MVQIDSDPVMKAFAFDDEMLLRNGVKSAVPRHTTRWHPRWVAVMDVFLVGSTTARELCVRFGLDPEEKVRA